MRSLLNKIEKTQTLAKERAREENDVLKEESAAVALSMQQATRSTTGNTQPRVCQANKIRKPNNNGSVIYFIAITLFIHELFCSNLFVYFLRTYMYANRIEPSILYFVFHRKDCIGSKFRYICRPLIDCGRESCSMAS